MLQTQRVEAAIAKGTPITGELLLAFAEPHPLSDAETVRARTGKDFEEFAAYGASEEYNLADDVFEVLVPASYRKEAPHGLFLWIGGGKVPSGWEQVLARRKLILLKPRRLRASPAIYRLPLDGVHNLQKIFSVDTDRVYVSGFSYAQAYAESLRRAFPEVFRGCIDARGSGKDMADATLLEKRLINVSK